MTKPAHILIVDDISANRETLRELLDTPDYRLEEAGDGPTALRLAAESPPDLVLLDVMMPGMDGFEVCRRLRADPQLAEVPVIMLTALDDQKSRLAGIEAGADDFLSKPFNRVELRARVRTVTRLNRYRRLHETTAALRESEQLADVAVREHEEWLKAIFDQAAVSVVQTDVTTRRFLRFNQRFCDLIGYTREETARLSHADITYPLDLAQDLVNLERLRTGAIREYTRDKRYVRKNGTLVWASVAVSGIGPPGELPTAFIAVLLDITERKRLDDYFVQAQKMEALGRFSGGVAHDFNNILAAIGGYTELSRMILTENPEVREHLGAVLKATSRAADLVRQILTFSRQEPQERQALQLHPIVGESLKLMRATIPATIEFSLKIDEDLPNVLANANQIHQVLMNLGINAWHAMRDRPGRLEVRLEKFVVSPEYAATKPNLPAGDYVRLSVSDTGMGMNAATLGRIFEPFFTTKPPGDGTGLGLSVVHGIMDGHDGCITVHSQLREGTVFRLYFPVHDGKTVRSTPSDGPTPRGAGEAVLVVDDEELLALMVQKTLINLGYNAEFVTGPKAALSRVREQPDRYRLVLSDQSMPGMTGMDLAMELRKIRADLPIILMTGYSLSLTAERIEEAGVCQLILKPVSIHALGSAVHAALASKGTVGSALNN